MKVSDEIIVEDNYAIHKVNGQIYFALAHEFIEMFDFDKAKKHVTLDLSDANFWDITFASALDKVVMKFRKTGSIIPVKGMNDATALIIEKPAIYHNPDKLAEYSLEN